MLEELFGKIGIGAGIAVLAIVGAIVWDGHEKTSARENLQTQAIHLCEGARYPVKCTKHVADTLKKIE